MKALLGGKFVCNLEDLGRISEVERIGPWSYGTDQRYRSLGEAKDVVLLQDCAVLHGEAAETEQLASLKEQLKEAESSLNALRLKEDRRNAVARIFETVHVGDGITEEAIKRFCETKNYSYDLSNATKFSVLEWIAKETS